jgi:hypothetical protein
MSCHFPSDLPSSWLWSPLCHVVFPRYNGFPKKSHHFVSSFSRDP